MMRSVQISHYTDADDQTCRMSYACDDKNDTPIEKLEESKALDISLVPKPQMMINANVPKQKSPFNGKIVSQIFNLELNNPG